MSESAVVKFICANQGSVNVGDLVANGCFGSDRDVRRIISNQDKFVMCFSGGEQKVVAKTELQLCRARDCRACSNVHLCKNFLLGACPFTQASRSCRLPHELTSEHNAEVLRQHGLQELDRAELCTLLLQNDGSLLPPICHDYNNGTGLTGRCRKGDSCNRLHICERYMLGPCKCPKAHDFGEPQPLKALQARGVPDQLVHTMKYVYFNKEALRKRENGGHRNSYQQMLRAFSSSDIHAAAASVPDYAGSDDGLNGRPRQMQWSYKGPNRPPYVRYEEQQWTATPNCEETEECDPENTPRNGLAYSKLLEEYNQLKDERKKDKELLSELQGQLAAAKRALAAKQDQIDAMKQKMEQKDKEMENMSFFKAQAEVYAADFCAERSEKEKIKEEKDRLAAELENMKRQNAQLHKEVDSLGRQSLNNMQRRHMSQACSPQGGATTLAGRGGRDTSQQQGEIPGHTCPKCDEVLPDLDSLQIHVMDCIP